MGEGRGGFGDDVTQDVVGFVQTRRTRARVRSRARGAEDGRASFNFFCKSPRGEKRNISVLQLNKQRHGYTYLIACIIDRFRSRGVLCSIR